MIDSKFLMLVLLALLARDTTLGADIRLRFYVMTSTGESLDESFYIAELLEGRSDFTPAGQHQMNAAVPYWGFYKYKIAPRRPLEPGCAWRGALNGVVFVAKPWSSVTISASLICNSIADTIPRGLQSRVVFRSGRPKARRLWVRLYSVDNIVQDESDIAQDGTVWLTTGDLGKYTLLILADDRLIDAKQFEVVSGPPPLLLFTVGGTAKR